MNRWPAALLLVLASCGSDATPSEFVTCLDFREIAGEYSAETLSIDGFRGALRDIVDDAQDVDDPAVAQVARDTLRAIDERDDAVLADAVTRLDAACTGIGV